MGGGGGREGHPGKGGSISQLSAALGGGPKAGLERRGHPAYWALSGAWRAGLPDSELQGAAAQASLVAG